MPSLAGAMTPFPHAVDRDATLAAAREMMRAHGIHHLPVTRDGDLVGVVSDEVVSLAERLPASGGEGTRVHELCTREPFVVDLHRRLDRVIAGMVERHVDVALIVRRGKLVGILTHADVCRVLQTFLTELAPTGGDDSAA